MELAPSPPLHDNIRKKLHHFLVTRKIPHLIFHGPPGTGKRTLVYDFINTIYENDKHKIKTNVMFVNCSHGKGIKFIREELKFFAKTNIQGNQGVLFKAIVLFNADSLTIDAQSALRRCIELFSHNTRFFIIVENKHKLLNPILSRFCEIYVPEHMNRDTGDVVNLHQQNLKQIYDANWLTYQDNHAQTFTLKMNHFMETIVLASPCAMVDFVEELYKSGVSCIDLIRWITVTSNLLSPQQKSEIDIHFQKMKSEFRCEKLLMMYLLDSFKNHFSNVSTL